MILDFDKYETLQHCSTWKSAHKLDIISFLQSLSSLFMIYLFHGPKDNNLFFRFAISFLKVVATYFSVKDKFKRMQVEGTQIRLGQQDIPSVRLRGS
jgi:hypothetical protein